MKLMQELRDEVYIFTKSAKDSRVYNALIKNLESEYRSHIDHLPRLNLDNDFTRIYVYRRIILGLKPDILIPLESEDYNLPQSNAGVAILVSMMSKYVDRSNPSGYALSEYLNSIKFCRIRNSVVANSLGNHYEYFPTSFLLNTLTAYSRLSGLVWLGVKIRKEDC